MSASRYLRASLLGLLLLALLAVPAAAQNTNSCSSTGFSSYSFTTTFNAGTNTTRIDFTFCNESPINGDFINVGEVYVEGLPAPLATTSPAGWQFNAIGPKTFWSTTSNPWWQTPPAIPPDSCLSGFSYTIAGAVVPDFDVFTQVFPVTDATGQQRGGGAGGGFDCSVQITPPVDEPCIDVTKSANPTFVMPNGTVTYTIRICNCGNTDLTVTAVDDTVLGDLFNEFRAANGNSDLLPEGECVTFLVEYSIPIGTQSPLENCVTVTAEVTNNGQMVMDMACARLLSGRCSRVRA